MRKYMATFAAALVIGCGEDPTRPGQECGVVQLPLSQSPNGPVVTAVGLEVQESGIVVVAIATDPQGSDNLLDVVQRVGVFPDSQCEGEAIVIEDDLVGSGVEETFGTVVDATATPVLYNSITEADEWPVSVEFRDIDDNTTSGRVMARVIR